MRRPVVVVLGAAIAVVLLSAGAGVAAAVSVGDGAEPVQFDRPSYPIHAESLPMLITDVSESAPGRSIVLADASGAFTGDHVLLAADSDRVRDVVAIAERADPEYAAATAQLSPDGRLLAVGDLSGRFRDVLVVDLDSGESRRYPVGGGGSVEVLAWSLDGHRLAYSSGALEVLDLDSGSATRIASPNTGGQAKTDLLPGEAPMTRPAGVSPKTIDTGSLVRAAFSPDGRSIAYDDGVDLEVYATDGSGSPTLLTDKAVWLAGSAAWSPDGKRVLVTREEMNDVDGATSLLAIDVATRTADRLATFDYIEFSSPVPVGWRGPSQVLLSGVDADGALVVDAFGVDDGRRARVMSFGQLTYSAQFASALIGSASGRDGGFTGGPTPTWWRVVVGLLTGFGTALVAVIAGLAVWVPLAFRRRAAGRRSTVVPGYPAAAAPRGLAAPSRPFVPGGGVGAVPPPGVAGPLGAAGLPAGVNSAEGTGSTPDWALPR